MPSSPGYKNVKKSCMVCGEDLILNNNRDIERKNFCSKTCRSVHAQSQRKTKSYVCVECGMDFLGKTTAKRCSICRNLSSVQSARSYRMMHNNPEKYFQHALYKKGRENLSVEFMMEILEKQNFKCAISNQPLTFVKIHGAGRVSTNASIDQIRAGEGYTEDNVQIVCDIVNRMKIDMDMEELKFWCNEILAHQGG